jgi:hypothetical protein
MEERIAGLIEIVEDMRPMTVREVFYQATVRGLIEKTEVGYCKIQDTLAEMRRDGIIPYSWIVDFSRWQRKPRTFDSVKRPSKTPSNYARRSLNFAHCCETGASLRQRHSAA